MISKYRYFLVILACLSLRCGEEKKSLNYVVFGDGVYIEVLNSASLQLLNDDHLTIELWAAWDPTVEPEVSALLMTGNNAGGDEIGIFRGLEDSLIMVFVDDRYLPPIYLPELSWSSGNLYFLALVIDSVYVEFYFEGKRVIRKNLSGLDINIGSSNLLLGADYDAFNGEVGNYWWGVFDEVRIWKRDLTYSEITFHYLHPDKLTRHFSQDGLSDLIAIWRFNREYQDLIPDGSGNGNHGYIKPTGSMLRWLTSYP